MLFFAMRFCALRCVSLPFIRVFQLGKRPIAMALAALRCHALHFDALRCLSFQCGAGRCARVFQLGQPPLAKRLAALLFVSLPCNAMQCASMRYLAVRCLAKSFNPALHAVTGAASRMAKEWDVVPEIVKLSFVRRCALCAALRGRGITVVTGGIVLAVMVAALAAFALRSKKFQRIDANLVAYLVLAILVFPRPGRKLARYADKLAFFQVRKHLSATVAKHRAANPRGNRLVAKA